MNKLIEILKNKRIAVISIALIMAVGLTAAYYYSMYKPPVVVAENKPNDEAMNQRENQAGQEVNQQVNEQMEVLNIYKKDGKKIAYLTFDDGPSKNVTPEVLDVLKKNNIHASFFVIGSNAEKHSELIKREAKEGNKVYNHTYSHTYKAVYASPEVFVEDVNRCDQVLKNILGSSYSSRIIRFPGGSFGEKLGPFRDAASKAGYSFIDWNALNGDAEGRHHTPEGLLARLKETAKGEHLVILMHDAPEKESTAQALQNIIDYLKAQGYIFKTL